MANSTVATALLPASVYTAVEKEYLTNRQIILHRIEWEFFGCVGWNRR